MPSNYTPNYQLSQWEAEDQVLRADFNADNAKIDAVLAGKGNCRVITGTYVGTGTYGQNGPNVLTFDRKPLVVIVQNVIVLTMVQGASYGWIPNSSGNVALNLAWSGNSVSWYAEGSTHTSYQMNEKGKTYPYIAFFEV